MDVLSEELSYLVSDLVPFTEYTFRVTASTTVGEGPAADITEKTREQGGCLWYKFNNCNKYKQEKMLIELLKVPNSNILCVCIFQSLAPCLRYPIKISALPPF